MRGALVNMLDDSKQAFARAASLIRARLLAGTILASDETSVRVGKRNWWTWVFHHDDSACFVIDPHRSRAVVESFLSGAGLRYRDLPSSFFLWGQARSASVIWAYAVRACSVPMVKG